MNDGADEKIARKRPLEETPDTELGPMAKQQQIYRVSARSSGSGDGFPPTTAKGTALLLLSMARQRADPATRQARVEAEAADKKRQEDWRPGMTWTLTMKRLQAQCIRYERDPENDFTAGVIESLKERLTLAQRDAVQRGSTQLSYELKNNNDDGAAGSSAGDHQPVPAITESEMKKPSAANFVLLALEKHIALTRFTPDLNRIVSDLLGISYVYWWTENVHRQLSNWFSDARLEIVSIFEAIPIWWTEPGLDEWKSINSIRLAISNKYPYHWDDSRIGFGGCTEIMIANREKINNNLQYVLSFMVEAGLLQCAIE